MTDAFTLAPMPHGWRPSLVRGKDVLVWRHADLETAFRSDPTLEPQRFEAWCKVIHEALQHHAAGRNHLTRHLSKHRHDRSARHATPRDPAIVSATLMQAAGAPPDPDPATT
jgi:hypothetical protein